MFTPLRTRLLHPSKTCEGLSPYNAPAVFSLLQVSTGMTDCFTLSSLVDTNRDRACCSGQHATIPPPVVSRAAFFCVAIFAMSASACRLFSLTLLRDPPNRRSSSGTGFTTPWVASPGWARLWARSARAWALSFDSTAPCQRCVLLVARAGGRLVPIFTATTLARFVLAGRSTLWFPLGTLCTAVILDETLGG